MRSVYYARAVRVRVFVLVWLRACASCLRCPLCLPNIVEPVVPPINAPLPAGAKPERAGLPRQELSDET
eukprot:2507171-Alexandrium_andersonii.AAC.1